MNKETYKLQDKLHGMGNLHQYHVFMLLCILPCFVTIHCEKCQVVTSILSTIYILFRVSWRCLFLTDGAYYTHKFTSCQAVYFFALCHLYPTPINDASGQALWWSQWTWTSLHGLVFMIPHVHYSKLLNNGGLGFHCNLFCHWAKSTPHCTDRHKWSWSNEKQESKTWTSARNNLMYHHNLICVWLLTNLV